VPAGLGVLSWKAAACLRGMPVCEGLVELKPWMPLLGCAVLLCVISGVCIVASMPWPQVQVVCIAIGQRLRGLRFRLGVTVPPDPVRQLRLQLWAITRPRCEAAAAAAGAGAVDSRQALHCRVTGCLLLQLLKIRQPTILQPMGWSVC
jgi:hypothetical protein